VIVISLGGSLIVPDKIDTQLLTKFKQILKKHSRKHKFVVVCGGGSIARKYIQALRTAKKSEYLQNMSGISITRMNARFLTHFFGRDANQGIPHDMKEVKNMLSKNNVVFCGALRYAPDETSDGTAASLAKYLDAEFINLTVVAGLFSANPLHYKNAKFIPEISWTDFNKKAQKIKYTPGQHFVLDQQAAKIIKKEKIKTFILGKNLNHLDNLLSGKKFKGTIIRN